MFAIFWGNFDLLFSVRYRFWTSSELLCEFHSDAIWLKKFCGLHNQKPLIGCRKSPLFVVACLMRSVYSQSDIVTNNMFQPLMRPSSGCGKCQYTNTFIFIVHQYHSTVQIIWFWFKFWLTGKTVTSIKYKKLKMVVCSMVPWNNVHRWLTIQIGEWQYSLYSDLLRPIWF